MHTAAVVTVSDSAASGMRAEDTSGDAAANLLAGAGFSDVSRRVVADDRPAIVAALRELISSGMQLVVTTGGTGFGPRDVTPEATREVIEKEAPGLAELMRAKGVEHTPFAALSRGVTGSAGRTLIVNLPGSTKGVEEGLTAIVEVVPHVLDLLAGEDHH